MRFLSLQYSNPRNPHARGGVWRNLHEAFRILAPDNEIQCWTGHNGGHPSPWMQDGVRYVRISAGGSRYADRLSFTVFASARRISASDVVILVWDRYAPVVRPVSRHIPVVLELHNEFLHSTGAGGPLDMVSRFVLKRVLSSSRYLIAVSRGLLEGALSFAPRVRRRAVIPAGIPDDAGACEAAANDNGFILFLGRLDMRQKGLDVLLEAYRRSAVSLPLVIAGKGNDEERVRRMIGDLGLASRIRMAGWVEGDAKRRLLEECRLVCMPSRYEGWPTVVVEAGAAGKPVLGTRVVGLEEAVQEGVTGILVEKDDIGGLSEAIRRMAADTELCRRLGAGGRIRSREFTYSRLAEKRRAFLKEVIEDFKGTRDANGAAATSPQAGRFR